jgi:hypothetical protein
MAPSGAAGPGTRRLRKPARNAQSVSVVVDAPDVRRFQDGRLQCRFAAFRPGVDGSGNDGGEQELLAKEGRIQVSRSFQDFVLGGHAPTLVAGMDPWSIVVHRICPRLLAHHVIRGRQRYRNPPAPAAASQGDRARARNQTVAGVRVLSAGDESVLSGLEPRGPARLAEELTHRLAEVVVEDLDQLGHVIVPRDQLCSHLAPVPAGHRKKRWPSRPDGDQDGGGVVVEDSISVRLLDPA